MKELKDAIEKVGDEMEEEKAKKEEVSALKNEYNNLNDEYNKKKNIGITCSGNVVFDDACFCDG